MSNSYNNLLNIDIIIKNVKYMFQTLKYLAIIAIILLIKVEEVVATSSTAIGKLKLSRLIK